MSVHKTTTGTDRPNKDCRIKYACLFSEHGLNVKDLKKCFNVTWRIEEWQGDKQSLNWFTSGGAQSAESLAGF